MAASSPSSDFEPNDGRYAAFEADAIVKPGDSVTIAIDPADRQLAALLWGAMNNQDGYTVSDGHTAVLLSPCSRSATPFHGGFVVEGPQCVTLLVYQQIQVYRARIPFGVRKC